MNRARRRRCRGAVGLLCLVVCQFVVLAGAAALAHTAAESARDRAQSGADAVAHALAGSLAMDPQRFDFEVALQQGATCALVGVSTDLPPQRDGDAIACRRALDVAGRVAAANGATVVVVRVGPDVGAYMHDGVAALFEVLVETEVAGPLAHTAPLCNDHQTRGGLCWAEAWSAAREMG